jgi:hypothetical protein
MSSKLFTDDGQQTLLDKFTGVFASISGLRAFVALVGPLRSSDWFAVQLRSSHLSDGWRRMRLQQEL